jgi:tetratricopeptide (TPR) repeat protein
MAATVQDQGTLDRLRQFARLAGERPGDANAQMFHGNALLEAGRAGQALSAYAAALALRPRHAPTLYNQGNAHLALGDFAAAERAYAQALAIDPAHAGSHNNRGNALRRLGRPAEAAAAYRAAIALRPELYGARTNLAAALLALHQPEAAEAELREALRLAPDYAEACNNMGGALLAMDRPEEALPWFRRAAALDGALVQARFGEAMALLTLGHLREGFRAYESRWLDPRFREDSRDYAAPPWLGGGDVAGLTILAHHEQGFGDTIQFARYLPLLRARGARVVLEAQAPLLRLLAPLADASVAAGAPLPPHDLRIPLPSLPHVFATTLPTIPAAVPYLAAGPPAWHARGPGLNVAVALRGSPDHPEDALRSIPVQLAAPLFGDRRITPHLVHKDDPRGEDSALDAVPNLRRHSAGLADFADTARLLAAMDLIVTVDTAVAHLAGALALPVFVLLQRAADFRWLRRRDDCPWYPTARLFRQDTDRRWQPVIARVAREVSSMV